MGGGGGLVAIEISWMLKSSRSHFEEIKGHVDIGCFVCPRSFDICFGGFR